MLHRHVNVGIAPSMNEYIPDSNLIFIAHSDDDNPLYPRLGEMPLSPSRNSPVYDSPRHHKELCYGAATRKENLLRKITRWKS